MSVVPISVSSPADGHIFAGMEVFRVTHPDGRQWRMEIEQTSSEVRARVTQASGVTVFGTGVRIYGWRAIGEWLADHQMSQENLVPW